jgi:hypothetical protein
MIEYLQGQVAKLTQHLAAQNIEMHCDIDDHNLESNFKNPYHNHVLGWEHRVWYEWHRFLGFRVELLEFYGTLTAMTVISKSQAHLPNPSHVEEEVEIN